MKRIFGVLAAGIVAAAGVLVASPASAAPAVGSVVTLSAYVYSSSVPGGVAGTLTCPAGDRLVGSGGGNAQIGAEVPNTSFTGATIYATVFQQAPANFAFITITCAPSSQFTDVSSVQTNDHRFKAGDFAASLTRCPAGYYAIGGGGYFSTSGVNIQGSAFSNSSNAPSADGNAWTFSGVMPPGANTLNVVAECAPRTGRDVIRQFGPASTSTNTLTSAYADCPAGYTVVAGGFYVSNPDGSEAHPASVIWSVPTSHNGVSAWYASGYAPVNTKVVALSQCLI